MGVRVVLTTVWLAGAALAGLASAFASAGQVDDGDPSADAAGNTREGISLGTDLAAGWSFYLEGGHCHLEQKLPDYGVVKFLGVTGMPLRFEVVGHRDLFADGPVDVYRVTPGWHQEHPARELLGQALHLPGGGVAATDPVATRVLLGLFNGYAAELVRHGWFAERGEGGEAGVEVGVKVSNAHLRRYYPEFVDCFKGPLLKSWAAVERTRVAYPSGASELDAQAREQLETLATYLTRDASVQQVFIDGHADGSGSAQTNLALSRRRAELAASYLEELGVPREKMVVRYHGSRYPVAENDTDAGREKNRRTTLRLERNWEVAQQGVR